MLTFKAKCNPRNIYICCEKDLSFTKSVEASALVQSKLYFSQHMNHGEFFCTT